MSDQLRREFEAHADASWDAVDLRRFPDTHPIDPGGYKSDLTDGAWRVFQSAAAPRDKLIEELAGAAQMVVDGLMARLDAAPSNAVPVFHGLAELYAALAHHAASQAAKREEGGNG